MKMRSLAILLALAAPGVASAQEADVPARRAAAKAAPRDGAASLALGRALRRAGRPAEAAAELIRGIAATSAAAQRPALVLELARARIDQRDLTAALRACGNLGRAPADACRAEAYLFQNRASDALPLAQKALSAEPRLYDGKVAEGRSLGLMGKVPDAEAALRAAIEIDGGRAEAHHHLGLLLLNNGRRDAGVAALKQAAANDPADPEIAFHLGEVTSGAEAAAMLRRAAAIRPSYGEAHAELSRASIEAGDLATAEAAAAAAIKIDPTIQAAHVHLGRVRLAQKRWDEALKEGEIAKKLIANVPAPELIIADAQAGRGDADAALDAYLRAFSLDRTSPAPLLRACRTARAAARITTARAFADKVVSEFPRFAPGWVELGDIAAAQRRLDRAREAYEAALKADGEIDREAVQKKLDAIRAPARGGK